MLYIILAILFILQKMYKLRVGFDICPQGAVIERNRYEKTCFQSTFLQKHTGRKTAISNPISEISGFVLKTSEKSAKSASKIPLLFRVFRRQNPLLKYLLIL